MLRKIPPIQLYSPVSGNLAPYQANPGTIRAFGEGLVRLKSNVGTFINSSTYRAAAIVKMEVVPLEILGLGYFEVSHLQVATALSTHIFRLQFSHHVATLVTSSSSFYAVWSFCK